MQKIVLCSLSLLFLLSGCFKKETGCPSPKDVIAPPAEQQVIADYLAVNNISATKHSSGFYYQISNLGTGESPNNCSSVAINYTGKLLDGTPFDKGTNVVFTLGGLIEGWQKGLPLIKRGGKIMLYIPPALAYGSTDVKEPNGTVVIPANSILIFEISLLDFQ